MQAGQDVPDLLQGLPAMRSALDCRGIRETVKRDHEMRPVLAATGGDDKGRQPTAASEHA